MRQLLFILFLLTLGAGRDLYSLCNGQCKSGLGEPFDEHGNARLPMGNWRAGVYDVPGPCKPKSVTPAFPPIAQGQSVTFTTNCTNGTWSVAPGSQGTINSSTGQYTAPATVKAQSSLGGWQFLPNNHLFNTNISRLPLNANDAKWNAKVRTALIMDWEFGIPINYGTNSTPCQTHVFSYTPNNNHLCFQLPLFPQLLVQGGYLNMVNNTPGADHHVFFLNTDNGLIEEIYQMYPAGKNSTCPTCTSASGIQYSTNSYNLMLNGNSAGGTSAADLPITPLEMRLQELEAAVATCPPAGPSCGTVNHMIDLTMPAGLSLLNHYVWPAQFGTGYSVGIVPMGSIYRLDANYPCANGAGGGIADNIAQVICTNMQQYGLLFIDIGGGGKLGAAASGDPFPPEYVKAFFEINGAHKVLTITADSIAHNVATITASNDFVAGSTVVKINNLTKCPAINNINATPGWIVQSATQTQFTINVTAADCAGGADSGYAWSPITNYFHWVDQSSLMMSSTSAETSTNRETVCYTTSSGSACTDIVLEGVALNFLDDIVTVMAGTPSVQLRYKVTGSPNTSVTWSMNPAGFGSISSTGLYTPPATFSSYRRVIVTATSQANSNVKAMLTLNLCPNTGCYFLGNNDPHDQYANQGDYTDTNGRVWHSGAAQPSTNQPNNLSFATQWAGNLPARTPNAPLFKNLFHQGWYDTFFRVYCPAGNYQVTLNAIAAYPRGAERYTYTAQGTTVASLVDWADASGAQYNPFTYTVNVRVGSDNILDFNEFMDPVSGYTAAFSSLSIVPGSEQKQKRELH